MHLQVLCCAVSCKHNGTCFVINFRVDSSPKRKKSLLFGEWQAQRTKSPAVSNIFKVQSIAARHEKNVKPCNCSTLSHFFLPFICLSRTGCWVDAFFSFFSSFFKLHLKSLSTIALCHQKNFKAELTTTEEAWSGHLSA